MTAHPAPEAAARRLPCRRHRRPRCRGCGLHLERCLCASLPHVPLPFEVWLVQHAVERDRPTNTGRILHTILPGSRILPYALRGQAFDPAPFTDAGYAPLLLFPAPGAPVLTAADLDPGPGRRRAVVLLDGTWAQGSHMRRRITALRDVPCRRLPDGAPGRWRLRTPHTPGLLCTLEAGVRLVRLAGLREAAARMDAAQDRIMDAMLAMKGRRSDS